MNATLAAGPSFTSESSNKTHNVRLLNDGVVDLNARLALIEQARDSIAYETFILTYQEKSARLILQALARKASQGVRVRLLVDHIANAKGAPEMQRELTEAGVDVRFYSPGLKNRRNHRKSLIVDRETAIIGGRNTADEYFFTYENLTLLDRDVMVRGPIVSAIQSSFDMFWNARESKALRLKEPSRVTREPPLTIETSQDLAMKEAIERYAADAPTGAMVDTECPQVHFASDIPHSLKTKEVNDRNVGDEVESRMHQAQSRLVIESPSFILTKGMGSVLKDTLGRGVRISVYTNSLESIDDYRVGIINSEVDRWRKRGLEFFVHFNVAPDGVTDALRDQKRHTYMIHSKTMVVDDQNSMVASFNLDPRSDTTNTELTFFCEGSPALASALTQAMADRTADNAALTKRRVYFESAPLARQLFFKPLWPFVRLLRSLL